MWRRKISVPAGPPQAARSVSVIPPSAVMSYENVDTDRLTLGVRGLL